MKPITKAIAACSLATACASTAYASEGLFYGGPTGGTDIGQAYLPGQSGFYGAFLLGGMNSDKMYGNDARRENLSAKSQISIALGALQYVYPFKLAGGTIATSAAFAYLPYTHTNVAGVSQYSSGVEDLYMDVLSWSRHIDGTGANVPGSPLPYGLTVKLAYSMILPIGDYRTDKIISAGHNVFFFIPNASVSYLTAPNFLGDGTEFTLSVFYDIASHNRTTNYSTGDVIDFDYAISERIGRWQVGIAGNYATQIQNDRIGDTIVNGNGDRVGSAAIGPVIAYAIPEWRAMVKVKYQYGIWQRNRPNQNVLVLTFAKAL
ncbi:transporter [Burkholderia anthina]|uniref:SphA family protein n=1 Tax=Burkholderia anthina TaxID=179879 RepID=UPI001CF3E047|nr:transporter [Burkholderia anthina]MCA8094854.1 transporter [Burkholderia anthina]